MNQHYYGLDIGIGSVGWAVLEVGDDNARIADFGVRLFDSGENTGTSETKNQQRRGFRATRRLVRRKMHRRERLKDYLCKIGFASLDAIEQWYQKNELNIYAVRSKGLDEKLSAEELAVCLVHISNHRGYKDFYGEQSGDAKEAEKIKNAVIKTNTIFTQSGYRTIGEMIAKDRVFCNQNSKNCSLPLCRNHHGQYKYMFLRNDIENEAKMILKKQKEHYTVLTDENIKTILDIIFGQRYFEYGPGNKEDDKRLYKGFLHKDVIGNCTIYKNELRGARHTVIGDLFAVINALSQYHYYESKTGEEADYSTIIKLVIEHVLNECLINKTKLKELLKANGIGVIISSTMGIQDIGKCIKYLKPIKEMIEQSGLDWTSFINEPQLDLNVPSRLHRLGQCLSRYITPALRYKELSKLGFVNDAFVNNCKREKFSGTVNVSDRFMLESILEAQKGMRFGNYLAKASAQEQLNNEKQNKLPLIKDKNVISNPVVFRAINESRKVINALLSKHGQQPAIINIEVASELAKSERARKEIVKIQINNEKKREEATEKIKELFNINKPKHAQIERYILYEIQDGKCLYSDAPIDCKRLLTDDYEIDHIIPYSLILDDSLNNKALVATRENREKGQKAPLEHLQGTERNNFKKRVIDAYKKKKISKKKYEYLMVETLENEKLLQDWKSRNINDTRYITKYIAGYLQQNLKFDSPKTKNVYGINGIVTSRFRQIWLKGSKWGSKHKEREETQLHHAIDAIVVANLTPRYIELASDYLKLSTIRREYKNRELPDEYFKYLDKCLKKMKKHYFMNEDETHNLLEGGRIPTIVPRLFDEVNVRFDSCDEETLRIRACTFYNDEIFACKVRMPMVSRKQERKFRGAVVSSENPISLKTIDGKTYQYKSIKLEKITAAHIDKIVGISKEVCEQLRLIFEKEKKPSTLGEWLKENDVPALRRNDGTMPNKLTMAIGEDIPVYKKHIKEGNTQLWEIKKYYCLEIYKDSLDNTRIRGIRYTDLKRKDGKLLLTCPYPKEYKNHVMYLFKNDYIVVYDRTGKETKRGFYQAVKALPSAAVYIIRDNETKSKVITFAQSCTVKKYDISILGEVGGEIKCGEPYSLLKGDESAHEITN